MGGLRVESGQDAKTEKLARDVVDSLFQVHSTMAPGLLEKIYEECLVCEFQDRNICFERQRPVFLRYKHHDINMEYRFDMVVEDRILLELKSVERMIDVYKAQTISYMKLLGLRLGFLVNFNVPLIRDGMTRLVL